MPSDLDILLPPDEQEEPGGGHGHVIIPQGTAHLYKEPSNKARLAKLKQDILGDGVKESKLDKYASLYNVVNAPIKVSELKRRLNRYYGGREVIGTTPTRLTEVPKADLMYLADTMAFFLADEFNLELEPGLVQLHKKLDLSSGIHIGKFHLNRKPLSIGDSTAQVEFTISDSGEPSVTYDLEYGQLYMMFIGPIGPSAIGSSAADLIIVNLEKTLTIVQPTSGSLNPNNMTPYDIDNSDDGDQPIADGPSEEEGV